MRSLFGLVLFMSVYPSFSQAWQRNAATREEALRFGASVLVADHFVCVVRPTETRCFPFRGYLDRTLQNIQQVDWIEDQGPSPEDSEKGEYCFFHDTTLTCGGDWEATFSGAPLKPDQVVFGSSAKKLIFPGHLPYTQFEGVEQFAEGLGFFCYEKYKEVQCAPSSYDGWGQGRAPVDLGDLTPYGHMDVRPSGALKYPSQIVAGKLHACALLRDGVQCWGGNWSHQATVPPLSEVQELLAQGDYTCAKLKDGTSQCWGDVPENMKADPFGYHARGRINPCVTKDNRLDCSKLEANFVASDWDDFSQYLAESYPEVPNFSFSLPTLGTDLHRLAQAAYAPKAHLFNALADYLDKNAPLPAAQPLSANFKSASSRLLVLKLLTPLVEGTTNHNDQLKNTYDRALTEVEAEMGVKDISDIDGFPEVRATAVQILMESLRSLREEIASDALEKETSDLLAELTLLQTQTVSPLSQKAAENLSQKAIEAVEKRQQDIETLLLNPRGRAFVDLMLGAKNYLKSLE